MLGGYRTFNPLLSFFVLVFLVPLIHAQFQCSTTDIFNGCKTCNTGYFLAINVSSGSNTCINISQCIAVDTSNNCVQCGTTFALDVSTFTCRTLLGCKIANATKCIDCLETNYYLNAGTCVLKIIDYCWKTNASECIQCSDQNIIDKSNCSINSNYCLNFNYEVWQCDKCSIASTLHSSGIFCYTQIKNCAVYKLNTCIQCIQPYFLNNNSCSEGYSANLYQQVLNNTYYLTNNALNKIVTICLRINYFFINNTCSTSSGCTDGTYNCTQCAPTYYLDSINNCRPCSQFMNCLFCDQYNCKQCLDSYYLAVDLDFNTISSFYTSINVSKSVTSQCLPCSIYGCLKCRNQFKENNINKVKCDRCLFGYRLFNHTCYACQSGLYFNYTSKTCQSCNALNCSICNKDPSRCEECIPGFYWNGTQCIDINTNYYYLSSNMQSYFSFEIFNKSFPKSSTEIFNNQILLIQSCSGKSNGYVCLCPNNSNITYTSLCYPINSNLSTVNIDLPYIQTAYPSISSVNFTSTNLSKAAFLENLQIWKLMSQLPKFSLDYVPDSGELLSQNQFAAYIQMKTNYIRNHYQTARVQALAIASFALNNMNNVFSPYSSTVFSGPGYYFKYKPATSQSQDSSFVSISQTNSPQSSVVLVLFNNTVSTLKAITGYAYVFLGNLSTSSNVTLNIKKIGFLESYQSYSVQVNGMAQQLNVSSDSDGFLKISNVSSSTSSSQLAYFVTVTNGILSGDMYAGSRIQNLIYRDSFIYILVIFALYFVFVPLCFLVDFVDKKAFKRKVPRDQEGSSYQGIKHNKTESQNVQSGQDNRVQKIYINYKDFFPIYNIANTPKPKRILKLCLFIVNIQHSITFLSLIYFHLPGGQALVAVLLAIPAYICTITMGYICGIITLKLPGNTKYLINVITIGYWIIWIIVMADFTTTEYKPYVYTFVVIFFFLDMLFDFLQTLLMYFLIKQDTRQIKLFRALSKWLSFRGYYEFDEMARDLAQARDNE